MFKGSRRNSPGAKTIPYFNFVKFERLLNKLRKQGVNVASEDYPVKNLKKYGSFRFFFENFSEQQIKTQLTFYTKQFEESLD